MSELDELRRIAYGRTVSAAEESAAADARAALAQHDAADRAARDADEFARSRADSREPEAESDDAVAVDIVDTDDEPGYLHRLATTWRVWAVPAFAAFVIGIAVTVASGWFILNANSPSNITPDTNTSQRFLEGSELLDPDAVSPNAVDPGDLAAASALLATEQQPRDVTVPLDSDIDAASTRLVYSVEFASVFAATDIDGRLCLLLVTASAGSSMTSCVDTTTFVAQGLSATTEIGGERVRISWDGVTALDSPAQ